MMAESGNGDSDSALPLNCSSSGDDQEEINPVDDSKSSETSEDIVVCSSTSAKLDGRQPSVRRKFRTLTFGRRYSARASKENSKKRNKGAWNFKIGLNCCRRRRTPETDIPEPNISCNSCVCTGYRRTEEHHLGAGVVFEATPPAERRGYCNRYGRDYRRLGPPNTEARSTIRRAPVIDLYRFNPEDYPIDDWDEKARAERAREIEEGIEPPPGYQPSTPTSSASSDFQLSSLSRAFQNRLSVNSLQNAMEPIENTAVTPEPQVSQFGRVTSEGTFIPRPVHTQVDYIHCLVPDLLEITQCSFYWGKMDRYEAEKLLENRPEGTFLLRDSAQEEYLFSVSFRRYSRSLHARIEQWNHKFSFDSHDPGVFASDTVCGLIEHYKDPSCCMFFEPMLTIPLHRTFAFPLQHLCRSVICHNTTYDGITKLQLPKTLKVYLKEYHYKQRVRVRRFEMEQ